MIEGFPSMFGATPLHVAASNPDSLPFENRLVVHTSGTSALNSISEKQRRGVFYPLQTFSKESLNGDENLQ